MVFDKEKNDNNNTNADGGKPAGEEKPGGGGGASDDKPLKAETHIVNVDGEDRAFTLEELKAHTSKVAAADKRFRDSSEATKKAERGIRVEKLMKSISNADSPADSDIRELAGLLEIDPKELLDYTKESDPPQKGANKAANLDFSAEFQRQFGMSPAEAKAGWDFSNTRHVNDARKEIKEISDGAVDKDEIIGKMVIGEDSKEVLTAVKDMVAEDVLRKIQDGKPFGAEMVAASVQRVRSQLTKLGIPKKLVQQPFLGLGPSEGFSAAIQADEPIKRVSSTDDADEKNLMDRYLQQAVKDSRKMR